MAAARTIARMIKVADITGAETSFDAEAFEADGSGKLYVRSKGVLNAVYAVGQWASARREEDPPAEESPAAGDAATIDANQQ